jgi:hypothetical protein
LQSIALNLAVTVVTQYFFHDGQSPRAVFVVSERGRTQETHVLRPLDCQSIFLKLHYINK